MAKAKRSDRRDSFPITSRRLSVSKPPPPLRVASSPPKRTNWYRVSEPVQDARIWQPTPKAKRPIKTLQGRPARVVAAPSQKAVWCPLVPSTRLLTLYLKPSPSRNPVPSRSALNARYAARSSWQLATAVRNAKDAVRLNQTLGVNNGSPIRSRFLFRPCRVNRRWSA